MSGVTVPWLPRLPGSPVEPLGPNEVHIWRAHRLAAADRLPIGCLDPAERQRAMRLILPAARSAFIFARAMLRAVAGAYLRADPTALRFATGTHGKPRLAGATLRFNLSHCGDGVILACAAEQEVGIDLEDTHRLRDHATLARASLSEVERRALDALDDAAARRMVLRIWTWKEALLKADGSGLTTDPRTLTLPIASIGSAPVRIRHAGRDWTLLELPAGAGWQASLAAENPAPVLRLFCLGWDAWHAGQPA
jgi:4'-phosphopantetheinyl transferase